MNNTLTIACDQLVVTPKPQYGESYMGFLLRTAESNGYPSINTIFRHAGLSENEMRSARPPLEKLAPLYGRQVSDFNILGKTETPTGRYLPLMEHSLPAIYMRSKHARICPDCVSERGHVECFWELRHAVACHRHQRRALSYCPGCNKTLDWWRQGLAVCSCGYDFAQWQGDKVTNASMLTLLELIHAKLMNIDMNEAGLAYVGFPTEDLKKLSLSTLLGIIHRLENYVVDADNDSGWLGVESTAEVLSCWPHGFHRYLERVHAPNADMRAKGLRGQFESFYEAFFKQGLPRDEIEFLHSAFVDFGEQHWKQASIHPRLMGNQISNIVGIEGLSKAIGIRPSTARKLVAKGVIPVHSHHPDNGHKLFDLSQQMPFEFAAGKSLALETAAEILDIPATVLRAYRARGYYVSRHLPSPQTLYHERDVEEFKTDLLRDRTLLNPSEELRYTTLRKVMLKKLGPSEVKAAFIDAIRKEEIRPIGVTGDKPGDLVFDARIVKDFLDQLMQKIHGTLSIEQAQKTLDIDRNTISAMIKANLLEYTNTDFGIRISDQSLQRFSEKFASCRTVAKLKMMTQLQVVNLCAELEIELLKLNVQGRITMSIFIERSQLTWLGIHTEPSLKLLEAA